MSGVPNASEAGSRKSPYQLEENAELHQRAPGTSPGVPFIASHQAPIPENMPLKAPEIRSGVPPTSEIRVRVKDFSAPDPMSGVPNASEAGSRKSPYQPEENAEPHQRAPGTSPGVPFVASHQASIPENMPLKAPEIRSGVPPTSEIRVRVKDFSAPDPCLVYRMHPRQEAGKALTNRNRMQSLTNEPRDQSWCTVYCQSSSIHPGEHATQSPEIRSGVPPTSEIKVRVKDFSAPDPMSGVPNASAAGSRKSPYQPEQNAEPHQRAPGTSPGVPFIASHQASIPENMPLKAPEIRSGVPPTSEIHGCADMPVEDQVPAEHIRSGVDEEPETPCLSDIALPCQRKPTTCGGDTLHAIDAHDEPPVGIIDEVHISRSEHVGNDLQKFVTQNNDDEEWDKALHHLFQQTLEAEHKLPGMTATPGKHNAVQAEKFSDRNQVKAKDPEIASLGTAGTPPSASRLHPGMTATPGNNNAVHQASSKLPTGALSLADYQPGRDIVQHQQSLPGITATPGYHNAVDVHTAEPKSDMPQTSLVLHAPATGGVFGFEANKKRKAQLNPSMHAEAPPNDSHAECSRGVPKRSRTESHEPRDEELAHVQVDRGAQHDEAPSTIRAWTCVANGQSPLVIRLPVGTTPGQLTQAEANLGTMEQPIAPRSWVNTHLPLHDPLEDRQAVFLYDAMPLESKCPLVTQFCQQPHIDFPCTRLEALWKQKSWVAQDEMMFYLAATKQGIEINTFPTNAFLNDTAARCEAATWLQQAIEWVTPDRPWISAAIVAKHWIPIIIHRQSTTLFITTTPEGDAFIEAAQQVTAQVGLTLKGIQKMMPQSFHGDCGFQAFSWIMALLNREPTDPMTSRRAEQWRILFAEYLLATCKHHQIIDDLDIAGTKIDPTLHSQLAELLSNHGVWEERVKDRSTKLIEAIPTNVLRNVLGAKKPWAELKNAANNAQPPIKLIQPDELNAQITSRANQKKNYGQKSFAKGTKKQISAQDMPALRAADLQVPQGVFKQQDGVALGPLSTHDVGNNSQGVILVDQWDAEALLRLQTPVSPHGLALIVLATRDNSQAHQFEPIRFPALCLATQEPLIASGYLYQLGAQQAQRLEPSVKLAVEEHETETIRCLVFRDQAPKLWDDIQKQPVKVIFSQEPILAQSRNDQSVVIDVWDRQWLSKRFEKLKPFAADIFAFSFRMMALHAENLVAKSGQNGIYYEPRTQCGRFPSPDFHVTWLPNMTYQDAQFAQQTSPHATTLTRHGDRFGLRSETIHAQAIHEKHRPDTPLLMGQKKVLYTVGPMPFSATKESITKLLKTWNWDARPLQPRRRTPDSSGISWCIQAVEDPSHWIYTLQHGDVLIARMHEKEPVKKAAQVNIVASRKTIEHFQQTEDPWLSHDPWQGPTKTPKQQVASQSSQPPTTAQLASIEANIEKRILAAVQSKATQPDADVNMDTDQLESRVTQLEKQIQQVHANQVGLDTKVNQMQCQLEQQSKQFNASLDQKLASQMDKIEALFSKRGRHE